MFFRDWFVVRPQYTAFVPSHFKTCSYQTGFESVESLEHIFEGVNGDSVYRGASFLAGKLGQKIAETGVTVIDDGSGISADVLPKIFEPHFSTRTSGSGLGLPITRRLIESWGGEKELPAPKAQRLG